MSPDPLAGPEHPTIAPAAAPGSVASQPGAEAVLDWAAYWVAFQELHGGDPVPHGGRLLFRDGWTHSATDHAGPEWPPPADPDRLRDLKLAYWRAQDARARAARDDLKARLTALDDLQRSRSAPLQVTTVFRGEGGKPAAKTGPLDLTAMRVRLEFLEDACREAARELWGLTAPAGTRVADVWPTETWATNPVTHLEEH